MTGDSYRKVTPLDSVLFQLLGLLIVAALVAVLARRIGLPYTVGLVLTGIALAFTRIDINIVLTRDLIFNILLPPLLFEGALNLHWHELRRDALPILTLTVLGVIISAVIVAAGMTLLIGWPIAAALTFAVLIAATDPVAVIAMFKDMRMEGRLRLLIESESLFNDGVAAVFFSLAGVWATAVAGDQITITSFAWSLVSISGGGVVIGGLAGLLAVFLASRSSDHLVETSVTVVAAYGSLLLAEHFHLSGVLAVVACGLVVGNFGVRPEGRKTSISSQGREFVMAFWDFAAFLANSFVFLMFGLALARVSLNALGFAAMAVGTVLVLISRLATVYPLAALFRHSKWVIPMPEQHALWWGGLRGALALALALSLPSDMPNRVEIITTTFAVVAFSVLVQGTLAPWVFKRLGLRQAAR